MRKSIIAATAFVLALMAIAPVLAGTNGNGSPSGPHYNLNIIGVPAKGQGNYNPQGSVVFVSRTGSTQFYVHGGTSYEVLDHDGTDGKVGTGLTDPGIVFPYNAAASPTWRVEIWLRLVGKPSSVAWTSAYWDGSTYVLYKTFSLDKSSKFTVHTTDLLADGYQDMLWTLEPGTDFRICQMRIYLLDA